MLFLQSTTNNSAQTGTFDLHFCYSYVIYDSKHSYDVPHALLTRFHSTSKMCDYIHLQHSKILSPLVCKKPSI